jgi:hypothetical protein
MIFQADMISAILEGRKTQTRRPVKRGDSLGPFTAGRCEVRDLNGRTRWTEGRRYSICPGRGKPRVGLIRILRITRERLDQITDGNARAEGFACREEFLSRWRELYPGSDLSEDVWVLEFDQR